MAGGADLTRRRVVAGRWRALAAAVAAALAVVGVGGCQPLPGEFRITNDTDESFMLWGGVILPGETAEFEFDDSGDCFPRLELVTVDLVLQIRLAEELCDGDRATLREEDVVPVRHAASVVNGTDSVLLVTFEGGVGASGTPLAPGERMRIVILQARAGCTDGRLYATQEGADGSEAAVYHPGPVCTGDEWLVDDGVVARGAAQMTIVNETGLTFLVDTYGFPDRLPADWPPLGPGERATIDLGVAVGGCLEEDAVIVGWTQEPEDADEREVARDGPFCDKDVWVVTDAAVQVFDRDGGGWGPATEVLDAVVSVTNGTSVVITIAVDDGQPVSVNPGANGRLNIGAATDGCKGVRITADVPGALRPQLATGLVEVCDGAQAIVTEEGIEVTSPDGPPWED